MTNVYLKRLKACSAVCMAKRLIFAALFILPSSSLFSQTTLQLGDLAFVHFDQLNINTPKSFSFVSRTYIDAGTVFYITNRNFTNASSAFSGSLANHATLEITVTEPLSAGQPFNIRYGPGIVESNQVSARYVFQSEFEYSNTTDYRKIWVYQNEGSINFVTGIFWNGTPSGTDVPTSLDGTNFLYDNAVSGASTKCGCVDLLGTYNLTSPITQTFYLASNWGTSTAGSGGAEADHPCNPNTFFNDLLTNAVFDIYRYGFSADGTGVWKQTNNTGANVQNIDNESTIIPPDWAQKTAVRRVEFYEDFTLGSGDVYLCAQLYLDLGVTLTLEPGAILIIARDLETDGTIHMKSDIDPVTGAMRFSQLAPTNAELKGNFRYDVYFDTPEWHHLMSPISSTLDDVDFLNPDGTPSSFSLSYTGASANIYKWNARNGSGEATWELTGGATADFSDEPYTIFIPQSVLPLVMRVEGELALQDQNDFVQQPAENGTGDPSDPGFGAPGWNGANVNGWNFYGNPFLSFYSTERLIDFYSSDLEDLNHNVFAYQSNKNGFNSVGGSNYYANNGSTGDPQAINIPPFQAFFMQHIESASPGTAGPGSNVKGAIFSKRVRRAENFTDIIQFRGASPAPKLALDLFNQANSSTNTLYLDLRDDMQQLGKNAYKDAMYNGSVNSMFGIYYDSMCYVIKSAPRHLDSLTQKVSVVNKNHGATFTITNHSDFDPSYESFLYDRHTNTMHNLSQSAYSFQNDTTFMDYRFDWFLAAKNLGIMNTFEPRERSWVWWSAVEGDNVALFTEADRRYEHGHVVLYDLNGRKLYENTGKIHEMILPKQTSKKQVIAIINQEKAIKIQYP